MESLADVNELMKLLQENITIVESIVENLTLILEKSKLNHRNCLIAKATGVGVCAAGTFVTLASLAAIPFTAGISAALPVAGLVMNGLGAATNIGTSVVDHYIQKSDLDKLTASINCFSGIRDNWKNRIDSNPEVKSHLESCMEITDKHLDKTTLERTGDINYVSQFLVGSKTKLDVFYTDEPISREQIKPGDHIYRSLTKKMGFFHHGVCLGDDQVVDFGAEGMKGGKSDGPGIRPLSQFLKDENQIYRRNYKIHEVALTRTKVLAEKIVAEKQWPQYDLVGNNCEHFATFLKLDGEMWSTQATKAIQTGLGFVAETVVNTVRSNGLRVGAVSRVKNFFRASVKPVSTVSTVSKSAIILSPLLTALDIGLLIYDWNKSQPSIEVVEKGLVMFLNELTVYKLWLVELRTFD